MVHAEVAPNEHKERRVLNERIRAEPNEDKERRVLPNERTRSEPNDDKELGCC